MEALQAVRAGVSRALPADLIRHLESEYPREGCGALLRRGDTGPCRVRPMRNVLEGPAAHTAYAFDPHEWLEVLREADAAGERLVCLYHSHPDTGAHFSAEDREWAAPDGVPLWPGVSYLVVPVLRGSVGEAREFVWNSGDFCEFHPLADGFRFEKPF
ncbi:M67 family metallopeptidase [Myxococcaceae bacterium GXIMD 01537]